MKKLLAVLVAWSFPLQGSQDLGLALKRATYLLVGEFPSEAAFQNATNVENYHAEVRRLFDHPGFYEMLLRYHELKFGVGLPLDYMEELLRTDIDQKQNKFAQIICGLDQSSDLQCRWASEDHKSNRNSCPTHWQVPVNVFWYPGVQAWVCPSLAQSCGQDLSRCFISFEDRDLAINSELGTTQAFDSEFAVIKSLSKQPAGIATAVVIANYPYTKILEPGLTAVDGAIAHFMRQKHHFDLDRVKVSDELSEVVNNIALTDTQFHLIHTGPDSHQAGVLSAFGWLRRYEKNRTRANQLYERLLCRKFTAELPRVFPQDPGNLRETPGCAACHKVLDPLADFYRQWGEGGQLYGQRPDGVDASFSGHQGTNLTDLANIIRGENAFATCSVQNAWQWLMGREFHRVEADLRTAFTSYFVQTDYSFRELLFAIATHPAFLESQRVDGAVADPLSDPPLGEAPGGGDLPECGTVDYATDIEPQITMCSGCHNSTSPARQGLTSLVTESEWRAAGAAAVAIMNSGQMPPGQAGPPRIGPVYDFKEAVRCWIGD